MLPLPEQVGDVQPPDLLPVLVHDHPEVLVHLQNEDLAHLALGEVPEHLRVSGGIGVDHDLVGEGGGDPAQSLLGLSRAEGSLNDSGDGAAHRSLPIAGPDDAADGPGDASPRALVDGLHHAEAKELPAPRTPCPRRGRP